jgi:integrase
MAKKLDFNERLTQVNTQLKQAKLGVTIRQRGNRLYLRAVLPPKPNSDKGKDYQQDIATGFKAVVPGLKSAEKMAKTLAGQLAGKTFDWSDYGVVVRSDDDKTVAEWGAAMKAEFFNRHPRTPAKEESWRNTYGTYLKRLPPEEILTLDLLQQTLIERSAPDSCVRRYMAYAFAKLGELAGLDRTPILALKGKYSLLKAAPRNLPDEKTIVEAIQGIPEPCFRGAVAFIATYGLRPHEVFHIEERNLLYLGIGPNTKTGRRTVPPLLPEWVDLFDLESVRLPQITAKTNSGYGRRLSIWAKQYELPFKLYDLRHAWAVRALKFNIAPSLSAKWMGHSLMVHNKVYQAWISSEMEQQIYLESVPGARGYFAPEAISEVDLDGEMEGLDDDGVDEALESLDGLDLLDVDLEALDAELEDLDVGEGDLEALDAEMEARADLGAGAML